MTTTYYRPVAMTDPARPPGALALAGGWCWFDRAEVLTRAGAQGLVPASEIPHGLRQRLTAPRAPVAGIGMDRPRIMAVLNITPDSFSDGGRFLDAQAAVAQGRTMAAEGADILDLGGESTRPGAAEVPEADERRRVVPVVAALGSSVVVSVDTRKAAVARAAIDAGARMVNDVSALAHDPQMAAAVAGSQVALCLMHMRATPATMSDDPRYDDVLLDVYDALAARIEAATAAGIARQRIVIDPGIGFAKTQDHNLALLRRISLFHGLGCALVLGVSRKRFIGRIGGADDPQARGPGTLALTVAAAAQGVQIHRVHDIGQTRQALALWRAVTE